MKTAQFLLAIVLGRTIRFGLISYIAIRFGQDRAIALLKSAAQHIPLVLAGLALLLALYLIYWVRQRRNRADLLEI
jgi:membrane protein DedA with SNARE-associated domain